MKKYLLISMISISSVSPLVNPFACKRAIPHSSCGGTALDGLELVGIIECDVRCEALVRWQGKIRTVRVGAQLGRTQIVQIDANSIRVLNQKKEYVLTLKSE